MENAPGEAGPVSIGLATSAGTRYKRNHDAALFNGAVIQGEYSLSERGVSAPLILGVADGVAAGSCAALASRTVLESLHRQSLAGRALNRALAQRMQQDLTEAGQRECFRMATTVAGLRVDTDEISWLSVGDSRIYRLAQGRLRQVTSDHTLRASMNAEISSEEDTDDLQNSAWDGLSSYLMAAQDEDEFELCVGHCPFEAGDRWLLCTDGLTGSVGHKRLEALLSADAEVDAICRNLIDEALADPLNADNVTVMVVRIAL